MEHWSCGKILVVTEYLEGKKSYNVLKTTKTPRKTNATRATDVVKHI